MSNATFFTRGFFLFLFIGLFLGDGKQSVIEVYGATIALLLWVLYLTGGGKPKTDLPEMSKGWVVVGIAVLISTVFSDSIGFSVSWVVRLLSGYSIYRFFQALSDEQTQKSFLKNLGFFVAGACGLSLMLRFVPQLSVIIPSMNLVSKVYGHSHLADLLVLVLPVLLWSLPTYPLWFRPVLFLLFLFFLISTWSFGAWFVVVMYIISLLVVSSAVNRRLLGYTASLGVLFCLAIGIFWIKNPALIANFHTKATLLSTKPITIHDRMGYWKTALLATKERPFFGSGPGTFSLTSKRLRTKDASTTWFAHSAPLELLSEIGLVGVGAVAWLIWQFIHRKRETKTNTVLTQSLLIVCVYGMFEYVVNYFVIWLLIFALLGVLSGSKKTTRFSPLDPLLTIVFICIGFFYIAWTTSNMISALSKRYDLAFYSNPFDAIMAEVYFQNTKTPSAPPIATTLAKGLHAKNSDILASIAKYYETTHRLDIALAFYEGALKYDPYNRQYHSAYIKMLSAQKNPFHILWYVEYSCGLWAAPMSPCRVPSRTSNDGAVLEILEKNLTEHANDSLPELLQKTFYLTGLDLVDTDPKSTLVFWQMSRDLNENWGYFPVEIAALGHFVLHDQTLVHSTLARCATIIFTKDWCVHLMGHPEDLLPVGQLKKEILALPEFIAQ